VLNVWEEADAAADLFEQLDQRATVWGPAALSGRFTVSLKVLLECRLVPILMFNNTLRTYDRAELMATRDLIWNPLYYMPENSQVEIEGVRWSPNVGTFNAQRAGNSAVLLRRCQVTRIQTGAF
jgi:hypothetical protein